MGQIKKSVGKGGQNEEDDVQAVQELLNKFANLGGYSKLKEDGKCGPKTLAAIAAFQQKVVKMNRPDQRVDPGGATIKKLTENPSSVAKAAKEDEQKEKDDKENAAEGEVSGATGGVNAEVLDFLELVSKYGGKPIVILDGKRDAGDQADRMFRYWTKTVDRGNVYVRGKSLTEAQRAELDQNWETAHDPGSSAADKKKAEAEFMKLAAKTASLHVVGKAVDLDESSLTSAMKKVLEKYMKRVNEKGCYHVQYKGKLPSEDTVKKELGAKT
jgi:hypothetical protein